MWHHLLDVTPTEDRNVSEVDSHHDDEEQGRRMARAVAMGAGVALPVAYLGVVAALLLGGRGLAESLVTAVLPGVLIGGFFGGFYGTIKSG